MSQLPNPYAPPRAQDAPALPGALELPHPSRGIRLLNLVIDFVAQRLLALGVAWGLALLGVPLHEMVMPFFFASIFGTWVLYYVACEAFFGVTIGKLITRTRVVDQQGRRPRFLPIVARTFIRLVPFEPFSFFANPPVGWHDRWSGTRLVRLPR